MRIELLKREQVLAEREVARAKAEKTITSLQMQLRDVSNNGCLNRTVPAGVAGILLDSSKD